MSILFSFFLCHVVRSQNDGGKISKKNLTDLAVENKLIHLMSRRGDDKAYEHSNKIMIQ
jgi:hypothetical protein